MTCLLVGVVLARGACADERAPEDGRKYGLRECLSLAERNHPAVAAARARLDAMRGQLEEARAAPTSGVALSTRFGAVPNSPPGGASPSSSGFFAQGIENGFGPFVQVGVSGTVPLWTFGKLSSARRAAEAQVRLGEWDVEREKAQIRMDVRRAWFGIAFAREALALAAETRTKLDSAIVSVRKRLSAGEPGVDEADGLRLEATRDDVVARLGEARKGEYSALACLRFLTGRPGMSDVDDAPLERPGSPLRAVVEYLAAARTNRADVNRARAGVAARGALVDGAKANLLPDVGLGMRFDYALAPGVTGPVPGVDVTSLNQPQVTAAFGLQWSLDFLTKDARLHQAQANLGEARALERLALGGIAAEVEAAHAAAEEASEREGAWNRAVRRARSWVVAVDDAIELGTKDERALVEPLRSLVMARISHLQSLFDANMTRAELARASGWELGAPGG